MSLAAQRCMANPNAPYFAIIAVTLAIIGLTIAVYYSTAWS